jgi:hypothetical protein
VSSRHLEDATDRMPRLEYSRPPESLREELDEVARDARALRDELARQNLLPADFPAEQLSDLLRQLETLDQGTAEGCREPLSYARARLPQIRREHILTEARSAGQDLGGEKPPPLTRGMTIDKLMTALIGSVATALDEYRRLAGEAEAEEPDTAPSTTLDRDAPDVRKVDAAAAKAETVLDEARKDADVALRPESKTGDDLKRQMTDARGLFRLSRIELIMPAFVPAWYRKTVAAIKDYPALLTKTAKAIKVVADVVDAGNGVWSRFQDRGIKVLTDTARDAAGEMEAFAKRRTKERDAPEPPPPPLPGTPPKDFDLDKVHDLILEGKEVPEEWRPWVTTLKFFYWDHEPEKPSDERRARLAQVADLKPLAGLENLHTLYLRNTQVADIAPLAGIENLHTLSLGYTQVADIAPLAGLENLRELYLSGTQVADIAPLAGLENLHTLDLHNTQVADIAPLAGLENLQRLDLTNTQVADIAPLAKLPNLTIVYVDPERVEALARTLGREGVVKSLY